MNYSVEYVADKIAECLEQIDNHQSEIRRLKRLITDLRYQPVTNEQGEVISYGDFENQI